MIPRPRFSLSTLFVAAGLAGSLVCAAVFDFSTSVYMTLESAAFDPDGAGVRLLVRRFRVVRPSRGSSSRHRTSAVAQMAVWRWKEQQKLAITTIGPTALLRSETNEFPPASRTFRHRAFSDGTRLISVDRHGQLRVDGEVRSRIATSTTSCPEATIHPTVDRRHFAVCDGDIVVMDASSFGGVWRRQTGNASTVHLFRRHERPPGGDVCGADYGIVIGRNDGAIAICENLPDTAAGTITRMPSRVMALSRSPNGRWIAGVAAAQLGARPGEMGGSVLRIVDTASRSSRDITIAGVVRSLEVSDAVVTGFAREDIWIVGLADCKVKRMALDGVIACHDSANGRVMIQRHDRLSIWDYRRETEIASFEMDRVYRNGRWERTASVIVGLICGCDLVRRYRTSQGQAGRALA